MIVSFANAGTGDIFARRKSQVARKTCPEQLWSVAQRKLEYVDSALTLSDLRQPLSNRLETLRGTRKGQHSIRINDQYRICFRWTLQGPADVEITDHH